MSQKIIDVLKAQMEYAAFVNQTDEDVIRKLNADEKWNRYWEIREHHTRAGK